MMDSFGLTHVGQVRSKNEDSFASLAELGFHVVADGMGGAQAGERASQIVVQVMVAEMKHAGEASTVDTMVEAVHLANRNIRWEAEQNPSLKGMGTTVVAAIVKSGTAHIVSVGDSRVYLRTGGELYCLTTDHSWVNEIGRGLGLTDKQLKTHPFRNVLTKAVGSEDLVDVDKIEIEFVSGDTLMLCSDGLHGIAGESALVKALDENSEIKEQAGALIEASLERGAPDNVTVVLVHNAG